MTPVPVTCVGTIAAGFERVPVPHVSVSYPGRRYSLLDVESMLNDFYFDMRHATRRSQRNSRFFH